MAFRQEVVNWTGDGVSGRLIPISFPLDVGTVAVIIIRRAGAFSLTMAHSGEVGVSYRCGTTVELTTTGVLSFQAGGFTVGTAVEVNAAATLYTAIVWRDTSSDNRYLRTGAYAGNSVDDRAIATSIPPTHVWVMGKGWAFKTPEMPATGSVIFAEQGGDLTTNLIKSITATGFTVGTPDQVNGVLVNYAWLALQITSEFASFFRSFLHAGLGGAGQVVSGFAFTPSHAYCQRFQAATSSPESFARGPQHTGTESLNIQLNTVDAADGISGFGSGTVTLGNVAAPVGVDVYGYAMAASGSARADEQPAPCLIVFPTGDASAGSGCVAPVLP